MLELLIAVILAVGFFGLVTTVCRGDLSSEKGLGLLLFSLGLIGVGILITITQFGFFILLRKIAGIILILIGFFMVAIIPRAEEDQPKYLATWIILIGFFILFLGIYWTLF